MDRVKRFLGTARGVIGVGFVLVFTGWLIAILSLPGEFNVIHPNFLLLFASSGMSTLGLMLGFIGAARLVASNRNAAQNEAKRKSYPWEKQQGK